MVEEPFILNLHAYKMLFILENNIRRFVKDIMKKNYGENWFNSKVDQKIRNKSTENKSREISYLCTPYRDDNPLNYVDISDLRKIHLQFWADIFKNYYDINDNNSISLKFIEVEKIRHTIAHNNLISQTLITQLEANINFFKTYINNYDENIHIASEFDQDKVNSVLSILHDISENLKSLSRINIADLKNISFIYLEIYELLLEYNKIPRIKRNHQKIKDFIGQNNLIEKINKLMEDLKCINL